MLIGDAIVEVFTIYWKRLDLRKFGKKKQQGQILVENGALALIYRSVSKKYGCKRKLTSLWRKKCKGVQTEQHLFLDRGTPGLNIGDGDQIGIRVMRDGKVIQQNKLNTFQSFNFEQ